MTRSFADTNVFVYAVDESPEERAKHDRAVALIKDARGALTVSTQVLQEFYVTVTRRLRTPLTAERAASSVRDLAALRVVQLDPMLIMLAIDTCRSAQLSLWDALIVEAARAGGCARILTEDLSHGQVIRGVEVVNPFLG